MHSKFNCGTNKSCSACGLMVDESTDVTTIKKLVIYVKIVNQCHTKTCFLANIDIRDGRAETTILNLAGERNIKLDRCVGFGSYGASVMVGIRSGVATRLKTVNPFIVSVHCAAHRLALTASQAAKEIAYSTKFMEMLHAIYNYFHNSAVHSGKFQEALEEPVRSYKEVFSVHWLSLYTAVDLVV